MNYATVATKKGDVSASCFFCVRVQLLASPVTVLTTFSLNLRLKSTGNIIETCC